MIREAYQSLLLQSDQNWEWIIEADEEDDLLDLREDDRVLVRNNDNLHIAYKRNRALLLARGDYVACLDDDDTYLPESLRSRADALDRFPEAAFSFGGVRSSDKEYSEAPLPRGLVQAGAIYDYWKKSKQQGSSGVFPAPAGVMWKKEIIWEMGGWKALPRSEDTAMLMRASVKYPAVFVEEDTYLIRQHEGRVTRDTSWKEEMWQWVELSTEAFRENSSSE